MTQKYPIIIIGAGAAGLMCAAKAASLGKKVIVLDHANKMAKKVLMSGGGRCNFTNMYVEPSNFLSSNPHFCKSALSRYTQWDFIALVEKYNIPYYEKSLGQLFCKNSSKDIRDLLLKECEFYGAKIQLKCSIEKVELLENIGNDLEESNKERFKLITTLGEFKCESLVIASGGLSIPTMGASDFGYKIAKQFGHTIIPTRAGLTPLTFTKKLQEKFTALTGNSLNVEVTCNNQSFKEAMLFTHKGLSGPAILQISSYWLPGDPLTINLLPDIVVEQWLEENKQARPEINLKTLLATQFSQAIASFIVEQLNINCKLKQIDHKQQKTIAEFLTAWTIYPDDVEGYRVAEVTLGGINTNEISSKTFESKKQTGLYFIGEVLDVTGHLGGFNFQWAWASGVAAGENV